MLHKCEVCNKVCFHICEVQNNRKPNSILNCSASVLSFRKQRYEEMCIWILGERLFIYPFGYSDSITNIIVVFANRFKRIKSGPFHGFQNSSDTVMKNS